MKNLVRIFSDFKKLSEYLALAGVFSLPFYVVRVRLGWASLALPEILIIVAVLAWTIKNERNRKFFETVRAFFAKLDAVYIFSTTLIIGGVLLSIFANRNYYAGLGILKGWFLLPIIFAIVILDLARKNKALVEKIFQAIFFSGAFVSFVGLIYWLRSDLTFDGRLRIFFDSPNQLAMTLAPALIAGIYFARKDIGEKARVSRSWPINFLLLSLVIFCLILTGSVGAILALLAAGLIMLLVFSQIADRKKKVIVLLAAAVLLAGFFFSQKEKIAVKAFGPRSSLASRTIIWKAAWRIAGDNPFWGIGPGNFQAKYLEYQKYFPPYLEWAVPQPHNLFLAWWLEAGALGLVGFLVLVVKFFKDNKKAISKNRELGFLCLAIMLYYLLHGLIDTTYWKNDSAAIFWLVVSINLYFSQKNISTL